MSRYAHKLHGDLQLGQLLTYNARHRDTSSSNIPQPAKQKLRLKALTARNSWTRQSPSTTHSLDRRRPKAQLQLPHEADVRKARDAHEAEVQAMRDAVGVMTIGEVVARMRMKQLNRHRLLRKAFWGQGFSFPNGIRASTSLVVGMRAC